jgi:hypothetical protein
MRVAHWDDEGISRKDNFCICPPEKDQDSPEALILQGYSLEKGEMLSREWGGYLR